VPRHQWMNQALYELPLGQGKLLGGWQINAILNVSSGNFLNVNQSGADVANVGVTATRPDVLRPVEYPKTEAAWFDRTAFAVPPRGRFGNAARNLIEGPGYVIFNAGIIKNIRFERSQQVQFGVSFNNILNHVNLGNPVLTVNTPNGGQIASTHIFPLAGSPRTGQLMLRYMF